MLMTSAAIAVTISAWTRKQSTWWVFLFISIVFAYTTIANIVERPDGIKIASLFILGIVVASFVSRAMRTTEIRVQKIDLDQTARDFLNELAEGDIRIVTNRREAGDVANTGSRSTENASTTHPRE